jgi:choline transporter-like protein 2/4/5
LGAAIDAIDASADFINENKRVILVPFLYFFLSFLVIAAWMVAIVVVISLNDVEASEDIPQGKTIKWTSDFNYYAVWYMIFGLLWILNWLDCTSSFVVQVSSATYYFNSSENGEGQAEISKGFRMAYLHHLGSIAIGAFIIALIQFIKIVFVYTA